MDEPILYIENTLREENCREYECIKWRAINLWSATDITIALSCNDPNVSYVETDKRNSLENSWALLGYYKASSGIAYGCFGTTYRSHLEGLTSPSLLWLLSPCWWVVPRCRWLSICTAEAWTTHNKRRLVQIMDTFKFLRHSMPRI